MHVQRGLGGMPDRVAGDCSERRSYYNREGLQCWDRVHALTHTGLGRCVSAHTDGRSERSNHTEYAPHRASFVVG